MNNNISKAMLRVLREDYEKACNSYLVTLLNMWELDAHYGFWIADEVGGIYSYGDTGLFIDMDDIRYIVENSISEESYREWTEYCLWANKFNQTEPTLKAWHHGFPCVDTETRRKLSEMRCELDMLIEETKEKF
jgi:hypothetical protein